MVCQEKIHIICDQAGLFPKQASFLSTYNNSAVSSSSDTFWHQLARDWWTRPEEFALGRAPSASRKLTHGKS